MVASLSLHYFDWKTTGAIVHDISQVLRPGGMLLCRVNRVGDVNFEYGVGTEWERDFFEVRHGHFKRFFDEESLADALSTAFIVDEIHPAETRQYGKEKRTIVAKARRRD